MGEIVIKKHSTIYMILGYLLAIVMVPIYVSMFPLWKQLDSTFNSTTMTLLPIIATVVLLMLILLLFRNSFNPETSSKLSIVSGIIICLAALSFPDPQFPAKRIHVAEYLLLSAVVRFAMSYRLQGKPLFFFSLFFTIILGIHDEFIQGLHPDRTYGLRDMIVNTMGSTGGALIWHGLNSFQRSLSAARPDNSNTKTTSIVYIIWIVISLFCLIWPCAFYTGTKTLPLWPATVLAGTTFFYTLYISRFSNSWQHGIVAVSTNSFLLLSYFIITNITPIMFF